MRGGSLAIAGPALHVSLTLSGYMRLHNTAVQPLKDMRGGGSFNFITLWVALRGRVRLIYALQDLNNEENPYTAPKLQ